MAYCTREQITAKIPPPVLTDALDDDGDAAEDAGLFDSLVAAASAEVDGYLQGLFTVPFADPAPSKVVQAAIVFVCESVYQRRNVAEEKNPFSITAKWWRNHLQKVGNREIPFDAAVDKTFVPGTAITTPNSLDASLA